MEHDHDTQQRPSATKRLVRHPNEGPLGGVCAGIARYFAVDPTIVRIAAVILVFVGPGVPAYLIAWAFVPASDGRTIIGSASPTAARHDRGTQIVGIALLLIAVSVLWGDWWSPARNWLIPVGCIGLGVWLLLRKDDDTDGDPAVPPPPGPAGPTARPHPWSGPAAALPSPAAAVEAPGTLERDETPDGPSDDTPAADGATSADDPTTPLAGVDGAEPPGPPTYAFDWSGDLGGAGSPSAEPRRRRVLGPIVFGALLLWAGVATLFGVGLETGLAVALCIVGVGFVLGAFIGGAWGLVVPAILLAGALVVSSIVDIPLRGGIGEKTWRVTDVDEARDEYELAIGEGTLDLRDLVVPAGRTLDIDVHQGIGHLIVLLPEGTGVDVRARVGAGDADVLDQGDEGPGIDLQRDLPGDPDQGEVDLDIKLGLGQLEVRQEASTVARPETPTTTSTTPTTTSATPTTAALG